MSDDACICRTKGRDTRPCDMPPTFSVSGDLCCSMHLVTPVRQRHREVGRAVSVEPLLAGVLPQPEDTQP